MIEVELFTSDHVIRGFTSTGGERISDVLNDSKYTTMYLEDVQTARLLNLGKTQPTRLMDACVEKARIVFARPVAKDITEKSLFRRATRLIFQIAVVMPNFEMHGIIHLTEKLDVNRVLITRPEDFIPLTAATATYLPNPGLVVRGSTLIFNKKLVALLGERVPVEETNGPGPEV